MLKLAVVILLSSIFSVVTTTELYNHHTQSIDLQPGILCGNHTVTLYHSGKVLLNVAYFEENHIDQLKVNVKEGNTSSLIATSISQPTLHQTRVETVEFESKTSSSLLIQVCKILKVNASDDIMINYLITFSFYCSKESYHTFIGSMNCTKCPENSTRLNTFSLMDHSIDSCICNEGKQFFFLY